LNEDSKPQKWNEIDLEKVKKRAREQYADHLLYRRSLRKNLHQQSDRDNIENVYQDFRSRPSLDSFLVFLDTYFKLDSSSSPDTIISILLRNHFLFYQPQRFKVFLVEALLFVFYSTDLASKDHVLSEFCRKGLWFSLSCASPASLLRTHRKLAKDRMGIEAQAQLFQWARDVLDFLQPEVSSPDPKVFETHFQFVAASIKFLKSFKFQPQTIFQQVRFSFKENLKKRKLKKKLNLNLEVLTTEDAQKRLRKKKSYLFSDDSSGDKSLKPFSMQQFLLLAILSEYDSNNRKFRVPQRPMRMTVEQIAKAFTFFPGMDLSKPINNKRITELMGKINQKVYRAFFRHKRPIKSLWNKSVLESELIKSDGEGKEYWINVLNPSQPHGLWDQSPDIQG
jgi:hypothetical protein